MGGISRNRFSLFLRLLCLRGHAVPRGTRTGGHEGACAWSRKGKAGRFSRQSADPRDRLPASNRKEVTMYLIREVFHCRPGKVRPLIEKFQAMNRLMEKKG